MLACSTECYLITGTVLLCLVVSSPVMIVIRITFESVSDFSFINGKHFDIGVLFFFLKTEEY